MEIKWIGNTSFLIKNSTGKRILLDPIQIYPYIEKYDLNPNIIHLAILIIMKLLISMLIKIA